MGFTKRKVDPNLYLKVVEDEPVILLVYVDDLFLTGNEKQIIESKKKLAEEFEMKDLGLMHYFLGLEVYGRDIKEIQYVRMQSHGDTHGFQTEFVIQ